MKRLFIHCLVLVATTVAAQPDGLEFQLFSGKILSNSSREKIVIMVEGKEQQFQITGDTLFKDVSGRLTKEFTAPKNGVVHIITTNSPDGWKAIRIGPTIQDIGFPDFTPKPGTTNRIFRHDPLRNYDKN